MVIIELLYLNGQEISNLPLGAIIWRDVLIVIQ